MLIAGKGPYSESLRPQSGEKRLCSCGTKHDVTLLCSSNELLCAVINTKKLFGDATVQ